MTAREILAWALALFFLGAAVSGGIYELACWIRDRWRQWRSK